MTVPHLQPRLSASDSKILNAVFDPESAPEAPQVVVDASLSSDPHIEDPTVLAKLKARELQAVKYVENCKQDDTNGRHEAYTNAREILDALMIENPKYASAWNNRAQLRRWRYGDRSVLTTTANETSAAALEARRAIVVALSDLDRAIALASPPTRDAAVSPTQGKLLAQAWTQRAAVFWGVAKDLSTVGRSLLHDSEDDEDLEWTNWDRTRFEEEGSRCFFMAGLYGSEVGRAMAVLSNPTAKLCGSIVKEAMKQERCQKR